MKYSPLRHKKRVLKEDQISKHVKVLRELPADVDSRIANIHRRNEILKANKHYQLKIERDRANAAIANLPVNQQRNLKRLLASLNKDMLDLARKGAVP